ncbi:Ubiquitin carboxyl-terminal hydrolase 36 [Armadillidium nasatum]|uniref:Ubiquitin carboxyl-terminal hydrolase 36 n=1 Tax=Armadillidium nasatum TaxID=96803 RepID=A0A5N5SJJ6_9CRUS|nr:Ubiquitin carboxyl-terminal hydrolase 36 [Armadillidium nasatum]
MVNLGNSCYMNSSLQALFHIPSLANWLLEEINTHIPSCESNPQNYSFCSICTMMRTIKQSLDPGTTVFKPLLLHNKLKCICKTFGYGRQEDAHEFIKLLIDHMEKSFLQNKRAVKLDHRSKETTPLNQIFGGYLRQQVICPLCCYVSTTFSHFQDLVLDIRSVNSVDEALNLYFKKETLDSDNAYKCEKCHKKVPATKRHLIERAPHVLLLQLKRFTISGGKITKHVNIQKNIDISRYVNGVKPLHPNGTGSYFYRLVSMVIHIGSSQHGGHYTAVAEASNNTMFEFDDASVRPISVQSALLKNPYILFYEMVRKPKSNSVPKQVIRQSSEKALIRQSSNDKISKPLPTSLSTSCMWNGTNSHATAEDIGEAVVHNGISNSKKSPLLPQKEREKISFGIKSHSGFSKGQEENKYSKPNGLILKRPFQLNSSSLTKSHTNGRNYVSSGLVPYNDESESSDDNESTDNRDTKDSCKFVNGHSNGHEKFVNKSVKSTDSSENSRSNNNNNGDKGNDSLKSKNHVEKMSNVDKIKKDKIKEDTTCSTSQGISGLNNKSTSFLPRSVQIQSSGNSKNVGGNKVNNGVPKILNGHSSTDNINEKKSNEHEKLDNVSLKEEHNDSYGTNSGNRTKKENGYICSSSSNGLSPVEVRTPNSSPSQSLTDRSKTKSKPEKVLKERDSFKNNISERLENGENYEEKSSKSKHQKGPQTAKVINAENHGCEENKKERNFSIKDEENFSMEEKKSRHKKKHKMKPNGAIKCDGSIPSCNGVSSNSLENTDSNIIIYNWNRNVKDLSDDLPSTKKNETVFSNNFIKNVSWNGSDDLSVVNALKRAGELPFGHEVKTWEGEESVFDKEIRKERNQAKKRSADDMYNDDYDRGKVRKKRFKSFHLDSTERRENPFQKFQNEYINNNNHKINNF